MPVVSDHPRSLFSRHRKTDLTKRVNAENAVRQSSKDSEINNNDNNVVTWFFPIKFKSLSYPALNQYRRKSLGYFDDQVTFYFK